MTVDVLGVPIQNVSLDEAISQTTIFFDKKESKIIVTPNAEILQMCAKDENVMQVIKGADYIIPDGVGVVISAKLLKTPLKGKVAGIDLAKGLLYEAAKKNKRVFFLGAKPGVADMAKQKLEKEIKGLNVCGTNDGYFKDDDEVIKKINDAKTDMLFVCLGAPKQEMWMQKNKDKLDICMMLGVGGSLDVFAGQVKRAPEIFIKLGLEWLYRLIKEPWRFSRMIKIPLVVLSVLKYKRKEAKK